MTRRQWRSYLGRGGFIVLVTLLFAFKKRKKKEKREEEEKKKLYNHWQLSAILLSQKTLL